MKHTGFNLSRLDIDQVAIPYQRFKGKYYTINELGFMLGEAPLEQYWRMRCYPASGLYTTVSDLSHFLIAHMNDGVYNSTRILKKETVELMHETQPNNSWYGLAWEHESVRDISVTGHSGTFPGVYTEMLYNQTADIGVILLTNGDPAYGLLPYRGYYPVISILYSLFTKEGTLRGETQNEFTI